MWFEDGIAYFDDDHYIDEVAWLVIAKQTDCGKFVVKLFYALIGYDILSVCMKGDETTKKRKKGSGNFAKGEVRKDVNGIPVDLWQLVYRRFEIFLDARGYTKQAKGFELLKINKYIHNACSYSRVKMGDKQGNGSRRNSLEEEQENL